MPEPSRWTSLSGLRSGATVATLALALAVAFEWPVSAISADGEFPRQRPADTRTVQLVAVAMWHFAAEDRARCPAGVQAWYAPDLSGPDGDASARGGACTVWLSTLDVEDWRDQARDPDTRADALDQECAVVAHEVGHALGLGHAAVGIMAPTEGADLGAYVPRECKRYRRAAIRAMLILAHWRSLR